MQDRTLKRIFILAGIALILWVLYLLKPVVLPFIGAFLVAYLFSPLVDKLHKIGLPRWLSISAVFIGIGVVITLAFWYLVPLVWEQLMYAKNSIPSGIHWANYKFLHGYLTVLIWSQWNWMLIRFQLRLWNMYRPIIVLTVFRL